MRSLLRLAVLVVPLVAVACVRQFSTDIPVNFQTVLEQKYVGRQCWTRATLQDEKKNIKIEQDQEVRIAGLGMQRTGSVTIASAAGRKRVVFPFHLPRPLTLEAYEKALLDYLWLDSPQARFDANKQKYGTRLAEAIRDHKVLKDMPQYAAYLSWGAASNVERPEGTTVERWKYDTANLQGARVDLQSGKVVKFEGDNIQDTEAAKKRKAVRRGASPAAAEKK